MAIALVYHNDPTSSCYNDVRFAVFGMSHAGQESHWFGVSDGRHIETRGNSGIVRIMETPEEIPGTMGVGRNSSKPGAEPAESYHTKFGNFTVAFDGYIKNGDELRGRYGGKNDGELAARFIADASDFRKGVKNLDEAAKGHFCLTMVTEKGEAYAARSRFGVRPLVYGEGERGQAIVTESRALGNIDMNIVRGIEAGEIVMVDGSGIHTMNPDDELGKYTHVCSFLWPYYQMIDCKPEGVSVSRVKTRIGAHMAERDLDEGFKIQLATPVPDSGRGYEEGYALRYGCFHCEIIPKYQYAGRSYERPKQVIRDLVAGVKIGFIPDRIGILQEILEIMEKKLEIVDVVLTEDSIRRGTQLVRPKGPIVRLRQAGVENIHVRVCSPRNIKYCRCAPPDGGKYKDGELAANRFRPDDGDVGKWNDAIAKYLDVKSVRFIELNPFLDCITRGSSLKNDNLCDGCYTGDFSFFEL